MTEIEQKITNTALQFYAETGKSAECIYLGVDEAGYYEQFLRMTTSMERSMSGIYFIQSSQGRKYAGLSIIYIQELSTHLRAS